MKNNTPIQHTEHNLLHSLNFITALKFEAEYANTIKGGHLPDYIGIKKRERLVSAVNILTSAETSDIANHLFIGKN
jgi:hypothetical protein